MKLLDRVEILINTDTVPRGCRGVVVDLLVRDGCCVEFFDDENNTIDVLPLSQRDLALVKHIDRDAVRAELERLEWDALECRHRPDGLPDTAERREITVRDTQQSVTTRVDNIALSAASLIASCWTQNGSLWTWRSYMRSSTMCWVKIPTRTSISGVAETTNSWFR